MCVCVYVTIWPQNTNKHLPFRCTSSGTVARRPLGCPAQKVLFVDGLPHQIQQLISSLLRRDLQWKGSKLRQLTI